jgi:hypothetical protein
MLRPSKRLLQKSDVAISKSGLSHRAEQDTFRMLPHDQT